MSQSQFEDDEVLVGVERALPPLLEAEQLPLVGLAGGLRPLPLRPAVGDGQLALLPAHRRVEAVPLALGHRHLALPPHLVAGAGQRELDHLDPAREELEQVGAALAAAHQRLISALLPALDLRTEEEQLSGELGALDGGGGQLVDLDRALLRVLAEAGLLALEEEEEGVGAGGEELERDLAGEEPEGADLVHARLVVDLEPRVLVAHRHVPAPPDRQSLQECRNAQVGVQVLRLPLQAHRVDVPELIAHEQRLLVVGQPLQLLVEAGSGCRLHLAPPQRPRVEDAQRLLVAEHHALVRPAAHRHQLLAPHRSHHRLLGSRLVDRQAGRGEQQIGHYVDYISFITKGLLEGEGGALRGGCFKGRRAVQQNQQMQLLVEVEFCVNCHEHAWCSLHDEQKYISHFQKIREAALQRMTLGDNISIVQMQPPAHFQKIGANPRDTKYYDLRKEEETFFPRLGAFEVYVDKVLIFSKLKSNLWPNAERTVELVFEMQACKAEGKELYPFEVGYFRDDYEKSRVKGSYRKRHINPRTALKPKPLEPEAPAVNQSLEIPRNILPELNFTETEMPKNAMNVSINNYNYAQEGLPEPAPEERSARKYHQIYSSALYEMKLFAKRERKRAKQLQRQKSKNQRYAEKKYETAEEEEEEAAEVVTQPQPKSHSRSRKNRRELAASENKQTVNPKQKKAESYVEDDWNFQDLMDPKEFNAEEKEKLYKKYRNTDDLEVPQSGRDIQAQKKKYETLLIALKNEEKNYTAKLETLNQKLTISPTRERRRDRRPSKVNDEVEKASTKKDEFVVLPPIKNEFSNEELSPIEMKPKVGEVEQSDAAIPSEDQSKTSKSIANGIVNTAPNNKRRQLVDNRANEKKLEKEKKISEVHKKRNDTSVSKEKKVQLRRKEVKVQEQKQKQIKNQLIHKTIEVKWEMEVKEKNETSKSPRKKQNSLEKNVINESILSKVKLNKQTILSQIGIMTEVKGTEQQIKQQKIDKREGKQQLLQEIDKGQKVSVGKQQQKEQLQRKKEQKKEGQAPQKLSEKIKTEPVQDKVQKRQKTEAQASQKPSEKHSDQKVEQRKKTEAQAPQKLSEKIKTEPVYNIPLQTTQLVDQNINYSLLQPTLQPNLSPSFLNDKPSLQQQYTFRDNSLQSVQHQSPPKNIKFQTNVLSLSIPSHTVQPSSVLQSFQAIIPQQPIIQNSPLPKNQAQHQQQQPKILLASPIEPKNQVFISVPIDFSKVFSEPPQPYRPVQVSQIGTQTFPHSNIQAISLLPPIQTIQQEHESPPRSQIYNAKDRESLPRRKKNTLEYATMTSFIQSNDAQSPIKAKKLSLIEGNGRITRFYKRKIEAKLQASPDKSAAASPEKPEIAKEAEVLEAPQKTAQPPKQVDAAFVTPTKPRPPVFIESLDKAEVPEYPSLKLHINRNRSANQFIDHFELFKNRIRKISGDNLWHCIKSEQILPNSGKYSFSVAVLKTKLNCIEVGIMPEDFIITENKICDKSIGYHFANGKIHDTNGNREKKSTSWRIVTDETEDGLTGLITLQIDSDGQRINWMFNNHKFAESVITNYLKAKKCAAYVSMFSVDDEVIIAPKSHTVPPNSSRLSMVNEDSQKKIEQNKPAKRQLLGKDLIRNSSKKLSMKPELKSEIKSKESLPAPSPQAKEKEESKEVVSARTKLNISESGKKEVQSARKVAKTNLSAKPNLQVQTKEQKPIIKAQPAVEAVSQKPAQQEIFIDKNLETNPLIAFYQLAGGSITKLGGDGIWHNIKTNPLPSTGRFALEFEVASSSLNCIEFGIMPRNYTPIANKVCDKSIGFHLANGKIHDTNGIQDKKSTAWRVVREPAKKGSARTVTIQIDADAQTMRWKVDGQQFAEGVITNYLKQKTFVAFVSMLHQNDAIAIRKLQYSDGPAKAQGKEQAPASEERAHEMKIEESPTKVESSAVKQPEKLPQEGPKQEEQSKLLEEIRGSNIQANKELNPFIKVYHIREKNITKTSGDGAWHSLKSAVLPNSGSYLLEFEVLSSAKNCIEFGIMPWSFIPMANKVCDKSIGFHLANGRLHDTNGAVEKKGTAWRMVREQAKEGAAGLVAIAVDVEAQRMRWSFNGEQFAESVITDYLRQKSFVGFVSMLHEKDAVRFSIKEAAPPMSKLQGGKDEEQASASLPPQIVEPSPIKEPQQAPKIEEYNIEKHKVEEQKIEAPKMQEQAIVQPSIIEAQKIEAPILEGPQTEAPQTEAPQTEAPQTEAPKIKEATIIEPPIIKAQQIEENAIQTAKVQTPKEQTPKVQTAKEQTAKVQAARVQALQASRQSGQIKGPTVEERLPEVSKGEGRKAEEEPSQQA